MAVRGAKPKPIKLRLVDGTHNVTRHGSRTKAQEQVEAVASSFGKLTRPTFLKGEGRKAWDRYIAPAGWLDVSREAAAIAFCELWQEFRRDPTRFPASMHGQMRAYMSELGLTDERNRGDQEEKHEDDTFD